MPRLRGRGVLDVEDDDPAGWSGPGPRLRSGRCPARPPGQRVLAPVPCLQQVTVCTFGLSQALGTAAVDLLSSSSCSRSSACRTASVGRREPGPALPVTIRPVVDRVAGDADAARAGRLDAEAELEAWPRPTAWRGARRRAWWRRPPGRIPLDEDVALAEATATGDGAGRGRAGRDGLGEVDERAVGLAAVGEAARHWVGARAQQHLAHPQQRRLADQGGDLLRACAGHRDDDLVLPCWTTEAPVRPVASTRLVHDLHGLGHRALARGHARFLVTRLQRDRGAAGQVKPATDDEALVPVRRVEDVRRRGRLPASRRAALARTVRYRPGRELGVLGGATSALSFGRSARPAARWSGRCGLPLTWRRSASASGVGWLKAGIAGEPPWLVIGHDIADRLAQHLDLHARRDLDHDVAVVARSTTVP